MPGVMIADLINWLQYESITFKQHCIDSNLPDPKEDAVMAKPWSWQPFRDEDSA